MFLGLKTMGVVVQVPPAVFPREKQVLPWDKGVFWVGKTCFWASKPWASLCRCLRRFFPQKNRCSPGTRVCFGCVWADFQAPGTLLGGGSVLDPIFRENVAKPLYFTVFESRRGTQKRMNRMNRMKRNGATAGGTKPGNRAHAFRMTFVSTRQTPSNCFFQIKNQQKNGAIVTRDRRKAVDLWSIGTPIA